MSHEPTPALRPDFFAQLASTDPFQLRARRLFERGQVLAVNGNQADLRIGYDAHNNPLELKEVPIVSGYVPRLGDWVAVQYEAGHSGAPWVTGPSMATDDRQDSAGIGVFSVSSTAPADPQRSTVYFDESRSLWRGWDGQDWVDFSAKLHNLLPDLQGGAASQYYHFEANAHAALHDLYDGDGIPSASIKRLNFTAIDPSLTQRTRLFEKDGDFFWAINATYDEQADQWNRVDTTKYAYLIALHSKNDIPAEPIGGIVWWRCIPGDNPIGQWASAGGWELGFMMTEHRNYVMGGMNLEMDGSGAAPYGRLTHIGSNDPSGTVVTAMQRNSWYEGGGQWARDSHDKNSAIIGFDENADLFVWWYPDSSEANAPWATAAWQQRARFHLGADCRGRLDVIRSSSLIDFPGSAFLAKHKTSANMADGFAVGYAFAIEDNAGVENIIARVAAGRAGADNTGKFSWALTSAGILAERMSLTAAGLLTLTGDLLVDGGDIGISGDTDLIQMAANALRVNGTIGIGTAADGAYAINVATAYPMSFRRSGFHVWGLVQDDPGTGVGKGLRFYDYSWGTVLHLGESGNATFGGDLLVNGGDIGVNGDADLIQMAANALTANGLLTAAYLAFATASFYANGAKPAAGASLYGRMIVEKGNYVTPGAGGDVVWICLKSTNQTYLWKALCGAN